MTPRRTLARSFTREGIGAFGGETCRVEVQPGPWGSGFVFVTPDESFAATPDAMQGGDCTVFYGQMSEVGATECLFAALVALGITDVRLVVEGSEIPALDGTAVEWLAAIDEVGTVDGPQAPVYVVQEPCMITTEDGLAALVPADGFEIAVRLDAGPGCVGEGLLPVHESLFRDELAWARRVVLDLEARQSEGALLATHEGNAVLVASALRCEDEGVRRLMVEALGDLAVLCPLQGRLEVVGGAAELRSALFKAAHGFADRTTEAASLNAGFPVDSAS